ncbi:MAG: hypothetical protein LC128_05380 [Chitinophagales bacterium]|nr:hypothetical protein [Chitinophagales bacterium]
MTFGPGQMTLSFNRNYFNYSETETLGPGDEILAVRERAGKGAYWMFYLVRQGQKKKKLFSIPAALALNHASRNNFLNIFEQRYNLQTTVKEYGFYAVADLQIRVCVFFLHCCWRSNLKIPSSAPLP